MDGFLPLLMLSYHLEPISSILQSSQLLKEDHSTDILFLVS